MWYFYIRRLNLCPNFQAHNLISQICPRKLRWHAKSTGCELATGKLQSEAKVPQCSEHLPHKQSDWQSNPRTKHGPDGHGNCL